MLGLVKTTMLSALVAGSVAFAGATPADAQVYFGFGAGGYHAPGPIIDYGYPSHSFHSNPYYYQTGRYGHVRRGWDDDWFEDDFDRGDWRRAERRADRAHRRFHRRMERRYDWD